jgi:hypothetical protein
MTKMCPLLAAAGAVSVSVDRKEPNITDQGYAADYHNNGMCSEELCALWVNEPAGIGSCVFVSSVKRQSALVKASDYIIIALRDMVTLFQARL